LFHIEKKTKSEYVTIPDDDYNEFASSAKTDGVENTEKDPKKAKEEKKNN